MYVISNPLLTAGVHHCNPLIEGDDWN